MPFVSEELNVSRVDAKRWKLLNNLTYKGKDEYFDIPAGYQTDFASVPRAVQALIPTTGAYTLAAVAHDYFCDSLNTGYRLRKQGVDAMRAAGWVELVGKGWIKEPEMPGPRDTDAIFRRMMRELGVSFLLRWLIWVGVRWGAVANPARRPGWLKDAFKVIILTILYSPYILLVGIPTSIALVFAWLVSKVIK